MVRLTLGTARFLPFSLGAVLTSTSPLKMLSMVIWENERLSAEESPEKY